MTMTCKDAMLLVLGQIDFTAGACNFTEMVGAVLPREVLTRAWAAVEAAEEGAPCKKELRSILGCVDYGVRYQMCSVTSPIGVCIDTGQLTLAREAAQRT